MRRRGTKAVAGQSGGEAGAKGGGGGGGEGPFGQEEKVSAAGSTGEDIRHAFKLPPPNCKYYVRLS